MGIKMPKRYNLTKFDILFDNIHALSTKLEKESRSSEKSKILNGDEKVLKAEAIIFASFASGQSWRTYNALINSGGKLNSSEVKEEYESAKKDKWKSITQSDIQEVFNIKMSDNMFAQWLFFNVDKDDRDIYKKAWVCIKDTFNEMCD